jgi:hypothetical protein
MIVHALDYHIFRAWRLPKISVEIQDKHGCQIKATVKRSPKMGVYRWKHIAFAARIESGIRP